MDAQRLTNEITKIISNFKSTSYVSLEILKVTRQNGRMAIEGWYEAGVFGERTPFKITLDDSYNVIDIDLTGRQPKS